MTRPLLSSITTSKWAHRHGTENVNGLTQGSVTNNTIQGALDKIIFGSPAAATSNFTWNTSGNKVSVSGSVEQYHWSNYNGMGKVSTSGSAQYAGFITVDYTGVGTVSTSGFGIVSLGFVYNSSGSISTSGSVEQYHWSNYTGLGKVSVSGTGSLFGIDFNAYNSNGRVNVSGFALKLLELVYNSTGKVSVSGSGPRYHWSNYVGLGTVIVSGSAAGSRSIFFSPYTGLGKIIVSGSAKGNFIVTVPKFVGTIRRGRTFDAYILIPKGSHKRSDYVGTMRRGRRPEKNV